MITINDIIYLSLKFIATLLLSITKLLHIAVCNCYYYTIFIHDYFIVKFNYIYIVSLFMAKY